ncbi:hypothetical protein [Tsukamurella hominis]|uniref:hypothetical protein n=1 Tax=Tsukamurella hominis TaxID=1970232 RepID=UPI0039EA7C12
MTQDEGRRRPAGDGKTTRVESAKDEAREGPWANVYFVNEAADFGPIHKYLPGLDLPPVFGAESRHIEVKITGDPPRIVDPRKVIPVYSGPVDDIVPKVSAPQMGADDAFSEDEKADDAFSEDEKARIRVVRRRIGKRRAGRKGGLGA